MVISLLNQKGGVGKTTLAVNIAAGLARRDGDVLLLDTDPQGSVLQWQSIRDNTQFDVVHRPKMASARQMTQWRKKYSYLVLDTPPVISAVTRAVLRVSDWVMVPLGPSPLDIWSGRETIEIIEQARKKNTKLEGKLVICRKIPRTRIGGEAREALASYGMEILEPEISQRVGYVEAMLAGRSVLDYPKAKAAAREMEALIELIP
jgi:chromosome partitioning protein